MVSILLGLLILYYPFGNAVAILVPAALGGYALLGLGRRHCVAATWLACGGYLLLWCATTARQWQGNTCTVNFEE